MLTSSYQLCLKHRPGFFKCEKADQPEGTAGESEVRPGPSNLKVSRRGRYYITPTIGESPSLLLFNLFSSEIVWPQSIFTRFATIPFNPRKNDYYAPYNKLLNVLFPPDSPFTVEPQSRLVIAESREPIIFWSNTRCSGKMPMCRSLSSRSRQDLNLVSCLFEKKLIFEFGSA